MKSKPKQSVARTSHLSVRVSDKLKKALEAEAKRQGRSLSNLTQLLLETSLGLST